MFPLSFLQVLCFFRADSSADPPAFTVVLLHNFRKGLVETLDELIKYDEPIGDTAVVLAWFFDCEHYGWAAQTYAAQT